MKEFQFKLIHKIVVTKKELHRCGIKADDEYLYYGEKDSIDHTFPNCRLGKIFVINVIDWFNAANSSNLLQQLTKNYLVSYLAHAKKKY